MTLPTDKHDLTAITTQRDQIGRMIRREESRSNITDEVAPPLSRIVRQGAEVEVPAEPVQKVSQEEEKKVPEEPRQKVPEITQYEVPEKVPVDDDDANDPMQQDPPDWIIQQASLSELLLWRLGIPLDRALVEREYRRSHDAVDLKPPITTRKVADAIAHLSLQLIEGKLDADSAKTSLYALQTLLTALRLQIVEEKKATAITKKKSPRKNPNAKRKR